MPVAILVVIGHVEVAKMEVVVVVDEVPVDEVICQKKL